jgi:hypothetical protein
MKYRQEYYEGLLRLSGMAYRGFSHNAKYWEELTGENPLNYPEHIRANSYGLIALNQKGHEVINNIYDNRSIARDLLTERIYPVEQFH